MLSSSCKRILAITLLIAMAQLAQAQSHFTECVTNIENATVIVPDTVQATIGEGEALESGDEIALFTADGTCAGVGTWDGSGFSMAAAGEDSQTSEGFADGETFQYRVWNASDGTEYDAGTGGVTYVECGGNSTPLCRDSGTYEADTMVRVDELDATSPLPVEMSSIAVRANGNQALLEWTTATETNNAGFEVQHQRPQSTSWTTLDFVEGHGTTSKPQTYRYETETLSFGSHRFRLKQVDLDGAFEYSETVEIEFALTETFKLSKAYPNPFQNRANVSLTVAKAQNVEIAVYNTLGQRVAVLHRGRLTPNQRHQFSVSGSRLPSGLYFVRARGESFAATRRLTHVR